MSTLAMLSQVQPANDGSIDDAELIAACAKGDAEAVGQLFDRYHRDVYRFLDRLAGNDKDDVDDLVQATFIEVLRSSHGFGARASVKTWLFGISVNVARHHVRSKVRRRRFLQAVEDLPSGGRPAPLPRPDEAAERRELWTRMATAIEDLPLDLRVVFVACEIEDLPGAEVAQSLGIREGTLWRRLHDARKAIQRMIEGKP